jgi:hypothetical protein
LQENDHSFCFLDGGMRELSSQKRSEERAEELCTVRFSRSPGVTQIAMESLTYGDSEGKPLLRSDPKCPLP